MARVILAVCALALGMLALPVAKQTLQAAKGFVCIATLDATTVSDLQKAAAAGETARRVFAPARRIAWRRFAG